MQTQNTPKNNPMVFGVFKFLPVAKMIEQTNQICRSFSTSDILRASNDRPKDLVGIITWAERHLDIPIDSVLDLHLRVGHTNENLLRIYFLYDKEQKRLVIGSLPRHLSTMSYK